MFIEKVLDGVMTIPKDFVYSVHSQNPVGAQYIKGYMNLFLKHVGILKGF